MFEININIEWKEFTWKEKKISLIFILKFENLTFFIFVFVAFWD
jgi:hypothetical protein